MFLLFSIDILFAETFMHIKPPKPGFFGVKVDENNNFEFVEIKQKKKKFVAGVKKTKAGDEITAWDFRLVEGSAALDYVQDQDKCGGCWAFASADVTGSTLFLKGKVNTVFSPKYLIDCHASHVYGNRTFKQDGCNGGYPIIAFIDIKKNGLCEESCIPWNKQEAETCPTKCVNNSNIEMIKEPTFDFYDAYHVSLQTLRDLVTSSGPCVAQMMVYDDLSDYKGGIYEHKRNSKTEGHAVTVYGFGTENGKDYWIIKNSWGASWGDEGFFKIAMGKNESGIEENFYSLVKNEYDYPEHLVPRPFQSSPGANWNTDPYPDCDSLKTRLECRSMRRCRWYDSSEKEPPFCDLDWIGCDLFYAEDCDEAAEAYGLVCRVNGGECVDKAGRLGIPSPLLMLLGVVAVLLRLFWS